MSKRQKYLFFYFFFINVAVERLLLRVCVSSTSLWEILGQRSYSFLFHNSAFFFLPATAQACAAAAASVMNCFFNLRLKALLQSGCILKKLTGPYLSTMASQRLASHLSSSVDFVKLYLESLSQTCKGFEEGVGEGRVPVLCF